MTDRLDLEANWTVNELKPHIVRLEDELERLLSNQEFLDGVKKEAHIIREQLKAEVAELKKKVENFHPPSHSIPGFGRWICKFRRF